MVAAPAIIILNRQSLVTARQIKKLLPGSQIYGLANRLSATEVDQIYLDFGDTLRHWFRHGFPIIGICSAGILIRTLAPVLSDKRQDPAVLAVAEDGSVVVPLLGGLQGVNELARQIATVLEGFAAITTTGDLRFRTALLSPPAGYRLANPEDAKTFISDLLAGATVNLIGSAPWLSDSQLPLDPHGSHTIRVTEQAVPPAPNTLVYYPTTLALDQPIPPDPQPIEQTRGQLAIVGTGPGSAEWMSPEVKHLLQSASDWVGYSTYLKLVEPLRTTQQRHDSENRVELERARLALNLAAAGKSVALVSSGDPGIFAMAAAVFEVLEQEADPRWQQIEIRVAPGISAMQAAAARIGAPLGHDFCVISLSDILKPWAVIEQRIRLAAQADFVIALYNPVSTQRTWQLEQARQLVSQWRSPDTPVIVARRLGRLGESIQVMTLAQLSADEVDMQTLVLIGSSQTRTLVHAQQIWVYTPRRSEASLGESCNKQ